ncbi:MAG: hypothetical protein AB8D78_07405 [Akkermansiaceae bacterium]
MTTSSQQKERGQKEKPTARPSTSSPKTSPLTARASISQPKNSSPPSPSATTKSKQVIIAVMRKLLYQIYGILTSGQPYNPDKRGFAGS